MKKELPQTEAPTSPTEASAAALFPGIDPKKLYKTKHLPDVTPYTASFFEAARSRGGGPDYIKRGRTVMYTGQAIINWLAQGWTSSRHE
jgi:hypothetical protein